MKDYVVVKCFGCGHIFMIFKNSPCEILDRADALNRLRADGHKIEVKNSRMIIIGQDIKPCDKCVG